MRQDPDVAALAARLGLTRFTYRTFARPALTVMAPTPPPPLPSSVARPELSEDAPLQTVPEARRLQSLFMPPAAASPIEREPIQRFPLLEQVLSGVAAAPASAQPFLDLRRAVAGPSDQVEC